MQGEKVEELDFRGVWRDDKDRIVVILGQYQTGTWYGYFKGIDPIPGIPPIEYTRYLGVNIVDGIRLMERKRGEEWGWD